MDFFFFVLKGKINVRRVDEILNFGIIFFFYVEKKWEILEFLYVYLVRKFV